MLHDEISLLNDLCDCRMENELQVHKDEKCETSQETTAIIKVRDVGGLDQSDGNVGGQEINMRDFGHKN